MHGFSGACVHSRNTVQTRLLLVVILTPQFPDYLNRHLGGQFRMELAVDAHHGRETAGTDACHDVEGEESVARRLAGFDP